jgi:hypothetical protein
MLGGVEHLPKICIVDGAHGGKAGSSTLSDGVFRAPQSACLEMPVGGLMVVNHADYSGLHMAVVAEQYCEFVHDEET